MRKCYFFFFLHKKTITILPESDSFTFPKFWYTQFSHFVPIFFWKHLIFHSHKLYVMRSKLVDGWRTCTNTLYKIRRLIVLEIVVWMKYDILKKCILSAKSSESPEVINNWVPHTHKKKWMLFRNESKESLLLVLKKILAKN